MLFEKQRESCGQRKEDCAPLVFNIPSLLVLWNVINQLLMLPFQNSGCFSVVSTNFIVLLHSVFVKDTQGLALLFRGSKLDKIYQSFLSLSLCETWPVVVAWSLCPYYTCLVLVLGCSTVNFWNEVEALLRCLSLKDGKPAKWLRCCERQNPSDTLNTCVAQCLPCLLADKSRSSYVYFTTQFPWKLIPFKGV